MVVRTKIKQTEEDIIEFQDKPNSIYPKNLELPDREQKTRKRRAMFDPLTKSFDSYMETVEQ